MPNKMPQFRPVQGTDKAIHDMPYVEGYLYFATDTGRMYLDAENIEKIPLGGSGASVLYANALEPAEQADGSFLINQSDLDDSKAVAKIGDLIINIDGSFYRVIAVVGNMIQCNRIAVSGTGGGGGTGGGDGSGGGAGYAFVLTETEQFPMSFVYNQSREITYEVTGPATASSVNLIFTIQSSILGSIPKSYTIPFGLNAGKGLCTYDLGSVMPLESGLTVTVKAVNSNYGESIQKRYQGVNVVEMKISPSSNFRPLIPFEGSGTYYCYPYGQNGVTRLKVYLDSVNDAGLIYNETIKRSGDQASVTLPSERLTHGKHTIYAYTAADTTFGEILASPVVQEIAAIQAGNEDPILWLDSYPSEIVDHDKLNIKFMAYNPVNKTLGVEVNQYVNDEKLPTSPILIEHSETDWAVWSVINYKEGENKLTLQCNGTNIKEDIIINVKEDTERDLDIIEEDLIINFDSAGRSNKENITSRSNLHIVNKTTNEEVPAVLRNFNWYNNGWINDDNNNACLRISNGASLSIPLNVLTDNQNLQTSLTFEFEFKLRNVREYKNLVTTTSKVTGSGDNEQLIITKEVQTEDGVFCRYYGNNIGLCLGTQEAFFRTGSGAVANGRYTDNDIVNVSFVIEKSGGLISQPLIYIYINGVNSGIINYLSGDRFNADLNEIIFNSEYCDVDLYKFRVYNTHLSSSQIVQNYIADKADVDLYDMNQIVTYENGIPYVSYDLMNNYNLTHPDDLMMPYAVVEVIKGEVNTGDKIVLQDKDVLPFVKGGKIYTNIEFRNPSLDKAWERNQLTPTEYITKAPSFYSTQVEFDVQGTSSQGYPRRNYKGKWKKATKWEYLDGPIKGASLLKKNEVEGKEYKKFYMDNKDSAEQTFTWKADYMESSGTHNTGFASYVKTLYSKHPLNDYLDNYQMGDHRTTIYGFPMMVFHKHWPDSEGKTKYEFVGKYNFNLDKGCNNVIDFENESEHPFVPGKKIAEVAECWELLHNQGGRVSFLRTDFDAVDPETKKLDILEDFEYRYNVNEDYIDAAVDGKVTDDGAYDFTNVTAANAYLRSTYSNLEKLIAWVNSTDAAAADAQRKLSSPVKYYYPATVTPETYEPNKYYKAIYNDDDTVTYELITYEITEDTPFDTSIIYYEEVVYEYDTVEYRTAKFGAEFLQHFDLEYCLIYFIMTELLIQYDSRGKNMMLASWGPQKVGGEYIWYPIFYDIDTQLGVNNSGVPSWEYDERPSAEGTFSTADSVLWNNFYSYFRNNIKAKYTELRKGNLTIDKLKGYYNFNPAISGSYAMQGCRPLNMINVDEYFKYIAPTFAGFINTKGELVRDSGTYFYCLQGTRELERELFLRNRFHFVDSQWLGGSFSAESVQGAGNVQLRMNFNVKNETSDQYIDITPAPEGWISTSDPAYKPELDSTPIFTIEPHLKQFCSVYYDRFPSEVVETSTYEPGPNGTLIEIKPPMLYTEEEPVNISPSDTYLQDATKSTIGKSEQLAYVGGPEYISSLGDLSLKYPNLVVLNSCVRMKDIILGNETEGYSNTKLQDSNCQLDAGAVVSVEGGGTKPNPNAKQLLETVVFTNLGNFTAERDFSGSEKLKTFRALGTNMGGVILADGTQIEILYLPSTITYIKLTEPVALTNLLDTKPVKDEKGEFPKGLYVQNLTDLDIAATADPLTRINEINISGGVMDYNSYKLIDKLIKIKQNIQKKDNLDIDGYSYSKNLNITLKDINWTPYRLVEEGEIVIPSSTYVRKTDHYTFEDYTPGENWNSDVLNGRVYEVNLELLAQADTITSLDLLDTIINDNTNRTFFYRDSTGNSGTFPEITGNIFINNTEAISEFTIQDKYMTKFPKLNIFVKNVDKAYSARFVEILDNGAEKEWKTYKYQNTTQYPEFPEDLIPVKMHYDFLGWDTNPNATKPTLPAKGTTNWVKPSMEAYSFSEKNSVYTFYAIYEKHSYRVTYWSDVGVHHVNTNVTFGLNIPELGNTPVKSHSEFYRKYRLLGWTDEEKYCGIYESEEEAKKYIRDVTSYISNKDYNFWACWIDEDVHTNIVDPKYLVFTKVENADGYLIGVVKNQESKIVGKITLPIVTPKGAKDRFNADVPAGMPILGIEKLNNVYQYTNFSGSGITHVFWESAIPDGIVGPQNMTTISEKAFANCRALEYFEWPNNITTIEREAFSYCVNLKMSPEVEKYGLYPKSLTTVGYYSFFECGNTITESYPAVYIPANVSSIDWGSFYGRYKVSTLNIGNEGEPTKLTYTYLSELFNDDKYEEAGSPRRPMEPYSNASIGITHKFDKINIYVPGGTASSWDATETKKLLGLTGTTGDIEFIETN